MPTAPKTPPADAPAEAAEQVPAPVHPAAADHAQQLKGAAAKLMLIQATIAKVDKTGRNTHQNFDYFQEHGVFGLLRPYQLYLAVAITVSQFDFGKEGNSSSSGFRVTLIDTETPVDQPDREIWGDFFMEATDNHGWGAAKLQTYGVKFALQKFLHIPTADVPEADAEGVEAVAPEVKADAKTKGVSPQKLSPLQRDVEAAAAADPTFVQKFSAHVIANYGVQKVGQLTDPAHVDELRAWVAAQSA